MSENFNCVCIKCKASFVSTDESDYDGEAFCSVCKEKNKEIASKIDTMIANRRSNRSPLADPTVFYTEARKRRKGTVAYYNI